MADNVITNPGAGGAQFRSLDDGTNQWPAVSLAYTTTLSPGANVLQVVTPSAGLPVAQQGTWAVSVSNFPATQPVSGTVAISGSVAVTGTFFQATQPVSGTVAATQSGTWTVAQGTAAAVASGWPVKVTDGTNTMPTMDVAARKGFVQVTDGTNSAAVKAASTAAAAADPAVVVSVSPNSNASIINAPAATQTFTQAGVITINTVLLTLDLSQYRGASIQCTSMGTTGVVTPEWSNDNATWVAATIFTPPGASALTFNAAGLWNVQRQARFLRLRLSTATTAGTTTIATEAYVATPQAWLATQPVSLATNTPTLAAGANLAADVGVQYRATATGAASILSVQSPVTPVATTVKAGAGRLLGIVLQNSAAAVRSVKLFNSLVAGVTLGTTAATFEVDIAAGGSITLVVEGGIGFATGITYAVTGAKGLTDNTGALGANDVSGVFLFA